MGQDFELSPEQRAIIGHHPGQHARVLAGPGTGKSFTAMVWLGHLVERHDGIRAKLLTFTRAATAEFAEKLRSGGLAEVIDAPQTVHAHALSVLVGMHDHALPSPLRIPDGWETKALVHPYLATHLRVRGHEDATVRVVRNLEAEMAAAWETLDPERVLIADVDPELRRAYVAAWNEHRRVFGYSLLAELPYRAGQALADRGEDHEPALDLLLVDEYQDLNRADIRFVTELSNLGVTIIAIGDDDQSIYGWRHAAPEGIRGFLDEFTTDASYPLTVSRRCGTKILNAASELIETAPHRAGKPALSSPDDATDGMFAYIRFRTTEDEANGVARMVAQRVADGVPAEEILLLARSSVDVWFRVLEPDFEARGLTISSVAWVDDALTEPALRRMIALGRLAENGEDPLAWWALTITLNERVGPAFDGYVQERRSPDETWGSALLRLHHEGFPELATGTKQRVAGVIEEVTALLGELDMGAELGASGWGGWLAERIDPGDASANASKLLEMVGQAVDPREGLSQFLNKLEPVGKDLAREETGGVRLMSMSQSKGLTVNSAIVLGVEEGMVPLERPGIDVNEERRLLYVAMTRATDFCVLTSAMRRKDQLARIGRPNVRAARGRSPLLADLTIGEYEDGPSLVTRMETAGPTG